MLLFRCTTSSVNLKILLVKSKIFAIITSEVTLTMFRKTIKEQIFDPFSHFLKKESSSSILMFLSMVVAIFLANSKFAEWYHNLWAQKAGFTFGNFSLYKPLLLWINDGLMAIFFLVIGLEIKREILIGELSDIKSALFPILAAIGGAIFPAIIYIFINLKNGNFSGWGIPMATDIAFAVGIISLLGDKVPLQLKIFITSLAVVDDMIAVLIIALFYTNKIVISYLIWAGVILLLLFVINRLKIKIIMVYLFLGMFLWYFFLKSGVHATIAGVLLALFIPSKPKIPLITFRRSLNIFLEKLKDCPNNPDSEIPTKCQKKLLNKIIHTSIATYNPMSRLEYNLHTLSAFVIMPIFAFANTGVTINLSELSNILSPISLGIILGLVIGKPIGITLFTIIFSRIKIISIPSEINMSHLIGASILAGIGLTMSIFIASMAFSDYNSIEAAKLAILISSFIAGTTGFIILKIRK
ncbi:Na+:H+ antiporter, NhaA family [Deferribacter desulfuricans SSM1]|uniref:Na(+)/H(+) antiporter NhaA n=1 Tax=Deferribacter desulfuricans (strain DSM 14783 / JCM 11476 / NBRC 101012 / SSM1) TaxID=639282 RepID=D3PDW6_DEFDS|nr:Na+/H+ antiporter NhaA [Deferribacter desulfuricans]BAI80789.1 Na+:H+ antiporter, NhaA family [Deferribacter desulfuricans SSM1]